MLKILKNTKKALKNCLRDFSQSGEISPNLVTLSMPRDAAFIETEF